MSARVRGLISSWPALRRTVISTWSALLPSQQINAAGGEKVLDWRAMRPKASVRVQRRLCGAGHVSEGDSSAEERAAGGAACGGPRGWPTLASNAFLGWACRETDGGKAVVVAPGTLQGDWAAGAGTCASCPPSKEATVKRFCCRSLGTVSSWAGRRLAEAAAAAYKTTSHGVLFRYY